MLEIVTRDGDKIQTQEITFSGLWIAGITENGVHFAFMSNDIVGINDLVQGVYIDVDASFKAQKLIYCLPF